MRGLRSVWLGAGALLLNASLARAQTDEQESGRSDGGSSLDPRARPQRIRPGPSGPEWESAAPWETAPPPASSATLPVHAGTSRNAPHASPEPRVPFGSRGQWVLLGSSNDLGISSSTFNRSDARFFDVGAELGLDRFVARNVSIGVDLGASYSIHRGYGATLLTETRTTSFRAGLRFGLNVPFGTLISWYPRLTLSLGSWHSETATVSDAAHSLASGEEPAPSSESALGPDVNLYAPVLVHAAPHFVLGFGPRLNHDFAAVRGGPSAGAQSTFVSGEFVVGGWWGGPAADRAQVELAPAGEGEPVFGSAGGLVFTLATTGFVAWHGLSRDKGSETDVEVAPSFDYFVGDIFSVGLGPFVSYSRGTAFDVTGATARFDVTSFGVAPRVGANLEVTRLVSVWPTFSLGYGASNTSVRSQGARNHHVKERVWLAVSAPVLVHVASHFFLGAGPYVLHELSDQDQYKNDNRQTSVGASLVLGGWLDVGPEDTPPPATAR